MIIYTQTTKDQDSRIAELANEAARAGDHEQVELCEIALGCGDSALHTIGFSQQEARAACLEVIADAESNGCYLSQLYL